MLHQEMLDNFGNDEGPWRTKGYNFVFLTQVKPRIKMRKWFEIYNSVMDSKGESP